LWLRQSNEGHKNRRNKATHRTRKYMTSSTLTFRIFSSLSRFLGVPENLRCYATSKSHTYSCVMLAVIWDLKVCDDGALVQILCFWTLSMVLSSSKTQLSRHQNAGRNHYIKTGNKFFENLVQFRYLGTTITNENLIQEEIKKRLNSGNACYHSIQKLLSFCLLSYLLTYLRS
jgi:hypothetical protein